jgi:hypothetical protein
MQMAVLLVPASRTRAQHLMVRALIECQAASRYALAEQGGDVLWASLER